MAKKFYVVWQGRKPGIYDNWNEAKAQVDKFAGAKYKSFPSFAEAKAAFGQAADKSIGQASKTVKPSAAKPKAGVSEHQVVLGQYDVVLYTDGGCDPNPGQAGSGVAEYQSGVLTNLWYGLYNPNGTNNTAELNALTQALQMAQQASAQGKSVKIFSDSQYSINCISNWAYGWKAKGWTRKGGEIANLELIQQAHELYESLKDAIELEHVAAHVGIEGNELADRMSIYAVDQTELDFVALPQPIDVSAVLALRAG
ncbi:ribonuclease HI [Shewanella sp. WXL01]|uniref:ribonuclease H1 domain-containing protein n=1 Tax=Shewanella sp. WXL01 TaxID=2709721 RepID=UPI00143864AA|nr:ribonuclease H family protein [Shewanella sp. WXL01]NKF50755.1 ribonuclease HI [Shewanella sp. WXL01]